jgi:hypothetical protein
LSNGLNLLIGEQTHMTQAQPKLMK